MTDTPVPGRSAEPVGEVDDAAVLASSAFAEGAGVAAVRWSAELDSTMDEAHRLAHGGAPAGTVVVADRQRQGRGRAGRAWASAAGAGVWVTLLERPAEAAALGVLSLRLGLALAAVLEPYTAGPVQVKWPNDLLVAGGKLAGILVEARWRGAQVEWVAVGVGVNRRMPEAVAVPSATVCPAVSRTTLLTAMLPAMRAACAATGALTPSELTAWRARDALQGRRVEAPEAGEVAGVSASGALLVRTTSGVLVPVVQGSVRFASAVLQE
jgi:BirA family biotin operon repressor/biotin-[acetyl-CoA-carboxylase] ligase